MGKKILTMIMTAALAASMCTGAFAAEADEEAATAEEGIFVAGFFSDTVTTYYKEAGAVEGIATGMGDREYAAGTAADLGAYIAVESDLVSAVTYDASDVDFETPGEYRAVYRVFISTEALEDYLEAEADEGKPEDADLGIDSDFIDICVPATVTITDAGEDAEASGAREESSDDVTGVDELTWTFEQMDSIPDVITGIGSITSADDEPEFTADAEIVDAVLYDTRALVGGDPEDVAYFTYFDREALLSYMDGAGIDPEDYPGLSEAVTEHIMVYCGPITELDLAGVLEGVTDHYVLIGSENIDYSYGVAYDDAVVKDVSVDSSAVDVTEPGTYTVRYTVTVDTGALAGAADEADAEDTEDAMGADGEGEEDASGETGNTEGTDDRSDADGATGGADLKDVVIEKDIDIVTIEEADELVTGGTAVWTDDNASYGDDEAANGNTKDKDTDEGAEADNSSSDADTDNSGSSSKSGDTAVKTGTGSSDSSSSSSSGSSSSGSSSSKSSSSNSNKSSSSSSSSSSSGSSTASTHTHTWTAVYHPEQGHYEQVLVQAAYDEQVCVGGVYVCNRCGYTTEDVKDIAMHDFSCNLGGGHHAEVIYETVHHDAVYESKYVVDSAAYTTYVCSGCGATK